MRSGKYVKNLHGDLEYASFKPNSLFDINVNVDNEINKLIIDASSLLNYLNQLGKDIVNINIFLASYIIKEATFSSQIEGTQATIEDVLDPSKQISALLNDDLEEVFSYIKALNYAVKKLENFPLCKRLILEVHKILLSDSRGKYKNPGEFRKSQNWIGPANSNIKNAKYIPPNVPDMSVSLNDLEKYINDNNSEINDLVKAALIHYQFETIHPFLDGNGRIGRMLIILYLINKNILEKPYIYISLFLKKNQMEYYDKLMRVRENDEFENWIKFFLRNLILSIRSSINSIKKMAALHQKNSSIIKKEDGWLLDSIEQCPIMKAEELVKKSSLNYWKINRTIKKFVDLGILEIFKSSKKLRTYVYKDFLDILTSEN